jgi:hypothetical protein
MPLPEPERIGEFLALVGEAFKSAWKRQTSVTVTFSLEKDGTWKCSTDRESSLSPFDRLYLNGDCAIPPDASRGTLAGLFFFAWMRDFSSRINPSSAPGEHRETPLVLEHPCRDEFLSRCLFCGENFSPPRPNKKYCGQNCRTEYCKWLKRLVKEWHACGGDTREIDQRLSKRLKEVLQKIS